MRVFLIVRSETLPGGRPSQAEIEVIGKQCLSALEDIEFDRPPAPIDVPGIDSIWLQKRIPRARSWCTSSQYLPGDHEHQRLLVLRRALERKASKLARYSAKGYPTIMLMESLGDSLFCPIDVAHDFRALAQAGSTPAVNEIWVAESSVPSTWFYPLQVGLHAFGPMEGLFADMHESQMPLMYDEPASPLPPTVVTEYRQSRMVCAEA
jgi:hypothetical protein